jgi:large subunit ribosomal protein L23
MIREPRSIVRRALVTEKGTRLREGQNGFLFEVARDANKIEIRNAVEKLWNVDVLSVRTSIVRGKEKRMGRFVGKRSNWKKAVVTIAAGQNVEFFEGV